MGLSCYLLTPERLFKFVLTSWLFSAIVLARASPLKLERAFVCVKEREEKTCDRESPWP